MKIPATCPQCGSDQMAIEFRDWFGDDDLPPADSYGTFIVCTKCGFSQRELGDSLYGL